MKKNILLDTEEKFACTGEDVTKSAEPFRNCCSGTRNGRAAAWERLRSDSSNTRSSNTETRQLNS